MPDGAWLDDTPEARMDRIKELLLMKPRQTYGREVRSPQHKAARRLGLPVPEGAPTPQQPPHTAAAPVYRPPAAPPVSALFATDVFEKLQSMAAMQPPPGKATSVEEEPQSPERSVTVSRYADASAASVSASSSLVVSLKLQNENLRVALQRATEEAAACRTAQMVQEFASFDKDCMKDREFIGSQEQYYRDYIMVERAVEERESSWTTAVRALESQQQDALHTHRRAAAEWKIQEANLTTTARLLEEQVEALSAQLAEAAAASVPAVAPPPPTSPARALVTGMRDELLQLRRQWNDDRTAHHRERGLWERERSDLIEALRIQKDVATAAEKVRSGRASQEPAGPASEAAPKAEQMIPEGDRTALAAVADMERRMKAREKKAQRAALFRERDFAAARVELEKDEASRRSILDFEEDMLRKELVPPTPPPPPPAPRQATSSPQRHWPASEPADGAGQSSHTGATGAPPQTHPADAAPRKVSTEALAALPSMVGELIQQSLASGALPPELLRTILAGTAPAPSRGESVGSEARAPSVPASVSVDTCGPRECTPLEEVEEGVPNPYSAEPVDSRTSAAATPEPQQRSAVALTDLLSSQMQDFRRLSEHHASEVGPPPTPDQQLPAATLAGFDIDML